MEKIEKNKAAAAVVGAVIVLVAIPLLISALTVNTQTRVFNAQGTAIDTTDNRTKDIGIVTNSQLKFGRIPVKSESIKFLQVNSTKESVVTLRSTGNISEALEFDEKLRVKGSQELEIGFNATEAGTYEGKVKMKIRTPTNAIGQVWLDLTA
ncbi:MAG: hypothetical protein ABEJ83_03045 [Candidatus Nanohaloarchaea archaeon]